ncbi:N-acetylmuramoyl-L-alanine amidase [Candidatus Pacearchaeota archaeon]|nr:N-acetylmuramoyl-L-alanine amidase [Candidatus Pacearchaeota archaeon]
MNRGFVYGLTKGLAGIIAAGSLFGQDLKLYENHIIQRGDTLWSLSRKYGVAIEDIEDVNPGIEAEKLQIGYKIIIPQKENKKEDFEQYTPIIKNDFTPNYNRGRTGNIEGIIIHSTEGLGDGVLNWLKNPQSKASAHYLIKEKGEIIRLVKEGDTAWHAGKMANKSGFQFTDEQYQQGGALIVDLLRRNSLDESNVVSHAWVSKNIGGTTHTDPGENFDWEKLRYYIEKYKIYNGKNETNIQISESR